jgi:epimerase transport system membrane fusion protein
MFIKTIISNLFGLKFLGRVQAELLSASEALKGLRTSFVSRWSLLGLCILLIIFGAGGFWLSILPIESGVIAPGTVRVATKRSSIQHLEGGIVKALFVKDGSVIKKGDVLIRLDSTRAESDKALALDQLDLARATEARLIAERDGLTNLAFPSDITARERSKNVSKILLGQMNLFSSRRDALLGELSLNRARIEQFDSQIDGQRALRDAATKQKSSLEKEIKKLSPLMDRGFVPKVRILGLRRLLARNIGKIASAKSEIAKILLQIGEAKLNLLKIRRVFIETVENEWSEVRLQKYQALERLVNAEAVLSRLELRSPKDGTVVSLGVRSEGDVIQAGQVVMEIVPNRDALIIEAQLPLNSVDFVKEHQTAKVRLVTVSGAYTPEFLGRVTNVSADRLTTPQGTDYYRALISISSEQTTRVSPELLHPGMPADIFIKIGDRTPLKIILEPFSLSFARSGENWGGLFDLFNGKTAN